MKFEKVTPGEAIKDFESIKGRKATNGEKEAIKGALEALELPTRATNGSAGYDFHCPFEYRIKPSTERIRIPLFVKIVDMPSNVGLFILNRSGLALKKGLRLDNAVGLIDSDYKEGIWYQGSHYPTASEELAIGQGDRICQGVFLPLLFVDNETNKEKKERNGGFGSTGR